MADIRTYLDYLNESIEIAPTNSQEELDAAELIEKLMKDHSLELHRQDVVSHGWGIVIHDSLYIVLFIGMLISGFTGTFVSYFGFIVCLVATVLLVLEKLHIFEISSFGPLAQSQNIIGVHRATGPLVMKGNRPIVVVAHYDTPNEDVLSKPQLAPYQARIKKLVYSAVLFTMFCALVQVAFFLPFLNDIVRRAFWLLGILSAFSFLALGVNTVYKKFASCTEGANSNKSSLAAMMDVVNTVRPADDEASRWGYVHPQQKFSEIAEVPQENKASSLSLVDDDHESIPEKEEHISDSAQLQNTLKTAPVLNQDTHNLMTNNLDEPMSEVRKKDTPENVQSEVAANEQQQDDPSVTHVQNEQAVQARATSVPASNEASMDDNRGVESAADQTTPSHHEDVYDSQAGAPKVIGYDVATGVVRRGKETLINLNLLPKDCEIDYIVGLKYETPVVETATTQQESDLEQSNALKYSDAPLMEDGAPQNLSDGQKADTPSRTNVRNTYIAPTFEEDYPIASWKPVTAEQKMSVVNNSETHENEDIQIPADSQTDARESKDEPSVVADVDVSTQSAAAEQTKPLDEVADKTDENKNSQVVEKEHNKSLSPEEVIISQIHQEVQARTQRDDSQVSNASQILEDEQSALGGSASGVAVARRAVLFDLPDPREQVRDPFASENDDQAAHEVLHEEVGEKKTTHGPADEKTITFTPQGTRDIKVLDGAAKPLDEPHTSSADRHAKLPNEKKQHGLGLFGKKKKTTADKNSMSSWLGVDDNFDAKKDGRQIGSWDNFVHEEDNNNQASSHPKSWKGGATTRVGLRVHEGTKGTQPQDLPSVDDVEAHATTSNEADSHTLSLKNNPFVQGGIVDTGVAPVASGDEDTAHSAACSSDVLSDENISEKSALWEDAKQDAVQSTSSKLKQKDKPVSSDEQIQELKDAVLSMGSDELLCHDIWFVALGASENNHAGMKQFLSEYRREIRGAFLINLDCVGAGSLTVLTAEDPYNTRRADRRITRLLSKIAEDLHIQLQKKAYDYGRTDATPAMHASVRSATIMGCDENGLPALAHTQDDVAHMIDAKQVKQVAQMVCELIRRA